MYFISKACILDHVRDTSGDHLGPVDLLPDSNQDCHRADRGGVHRRRRHDVHSLLPHHSLRSGNISALMKL